MRIIIFFDEFYCHYIFLTFIILTLSLYRIQKWYTIYKDHVTLEDYEIHDGMGLELYYN
jgi:uncharacterized CHY-type Zn-finger protein